MILAANSGIYITHNAGNSWTNVSVFGVKQLLYNPGDTNIIYGTLSGGSAQIIRSKDGGNTWNNVTSLTGAQRINIAVSQANSAIVTAIASNNNSGLLGVYRSVDTGATYTPVFVDDAGCTNNILGYDLGLPTSNCGGQGWYDLCIAMDPLNANYIIIGGVNTYYSYDGGVTWTLANQWYATTWNSQTVHADKHCLAYNKLTGAIYETCDGGVYKSYAPLTGPWTDLTNGICITEFYKNAVANGVPFCIGGAQDNGTKMIHGDTATDIRGGDGMQCRIDYSDPNNIFYASYPNGSIDVTFNGGLSYASITNSLTGSGDWVTPYIIHPANPAVLLLGYNQVFASYDYGNSWAPISPVFSSNNINTIAIPFTNTNYIYVVSDDNKIHYTTNFGATWSLINVPVPASNYISDLAVDPKNEKRFWVTMSGYGGDKVLGYNLATGTWAHESGTLPDIPVNCILIDTFSSAKYIGTDAAVFYKDTTMSDWALYNSHLPSVRVSDLNINYSTGEMWAATFGRGMWKTTKADHPNGVPSVPLTAATITVFPDPNHGIFTINTNYKEFKGQSVTVKLMTPDGRIAWQKEAVFDNAGDLKINTGNLLKGAYICVVSNKNKVTRSKVVVY
ncbi:MAG: T9SS type A sorting domain-containing protein [Chitinophagales bacterium]